MSLNEVASEAGTSITNVSRTVASSLNSSSKWAALSAAEYWHRHKCNQMAELGQMQSITRAINGGLNGLPDREMRLAWAQEAL